MNGYIVQKKRKGQVCSLSEIRSAVKSRLSEEVGAGQVIEKNAQEGAAEFLSAGKYFSLPKYNSFVSSGVQLRGHVCRTLQFSVFLNNEEFE